MRGTGNFVSWRKTRFYQCAKTLRLAYHKAPQRIDFRAMYSPYLSFSAARRPIAPIAAALCFALAGSASAQNLEECRNIPDDTQRLACYDRVPRLPAAAPKTEATSLADIPAANLKNSAKAGIADSLLGKAWELDPENRGKILRIRPYKPVYVLPLFYSSRPNQFPSSPSPGHSVSSPQNINSGEAKIQISLKTKLAEDLFGDNGDLWFGYTQTSRWQVYSAGISRPFRETNHEPEAMLVWKTNYDVAGWNGRFFNLSLNHQSNGRSLPLSRSWNRVMFSVDLEREDWTLSLRPWWRIPEGAAQDDNPDISNYLGRADMHLVRRWGNHQFSLMLRHSLRSGRDSHGAMQLDYAFPIAGEMRGHLQWFSGYGESMIDYNRRANYYGVGVSLLEWY